MQQKNQQPLLPPTKINIKEKIDEDDILKTEKGKDQDNACICTGRRGFRRIKEIKGTKDIHLTGNWERK